MIQEIISMWPFWTVGLLIFFILARNAVRARKCSVCSTETRDAYRKQWAKEAYMCRNHLVEQWERDVLAFPHNMVVIEPDLVKYPQAYLYADMKTLRNWEYPEIAQKNISKILDGIAGHTCHSCSKPATVAYFSKTEYEPPLMENISTTPTYLCKVCVVGKVKPLLSIAPGPFFEGLYAPETGPGIFHVQEF